MTNKFETLITDLRTRSDDWCRDGLPYLSASLARAADTIVTLESERQQLAALLAECDRALSPSSGDLLRRIRAALAETAEGASSPAQNRL